MPRQIDVIYDNGVLRPLAAGENLHGAIVRGLRRPEPGIDLEERANRACRNGPHPEK